MHTCPVCGYPHLQELPRSDGAGGSFEICPSCGFQFGISDDDEGITYEQWRARWIAEGMRWSSVGIPKPAGWNPEDQLRRINV
jgi:rRNA maturation protein Nop10